MLRSIRTADERTMRAFTFTPEAKVLAALQRKHASPGEVFFGLLITQEPKEDPNCATVVRAMTEREYRELLTAISEKGKIGRPDKGLIFIGPNAGQIARGSGRTLLQKTLPLGKGFEKLVVNKTVRPLGSSPGTKKRDPEPKPVVDPLSGWNGEEDPFEQAVDQALMAYEAEERGAPPPQTYASAAQQAADQYEGEATPRTAEEMDPATRLQWAQQVAFQSSTETMRQRPGQAPPAALDPLHPANRAKMAHQIGLQSTFASMPNGDRMAEMMGFGQQPPQARPQGRRRAPSIEDQVVEDLFPRRRGR